MAAWYGWILTLHLFCAIMFVGAVAFEVLILEGLTPAFAPAQMHRIEEVVQKRARRLMPFFVALLFLSGFALFSIRCPNFECVNTRFGIMLLIKVALAFGVLAVFLNAMWAGLRGRMDPCRFRITHRIVLGMMIAIVFLAKAMFFL